MHHFCLRTHEKPLPIIVGRSVSSELEEQLDASLVIMTPLCNPPQFKGYTLPPTSTSIQIGTLWLLSGLSDGIHCSSRLMTDR